MTAVSHWADIVVRLPLDRTSMAVESCLDLVKRGWRLW